MEWLKYLILGILQGLTEFLPVSSSAHLILFKDIFGIEIGLFFDIMLHVGTLAAVCWVLRRDIIALLNRPMNRLWWLIAASVPAALLGFFAESLIEEVFSDGKWLFIPFLITAGLLFTADIASKKIQMKKQAENLPEEFNFRHAMFMGLGQTAGILPGISRSGSTISAGLLSGGKRNDVAVFSFLMSIPIILGSFAFSLLKLMTSNEPLIAAERAAIGEQIFPILLAIAAAAVVGYFVIRFMINLIRKCNLKWFSLYLVCLSVIVFINYWVGAIW